jgi:hypothetical protein
MDKGDLEDEVDALQRMSEHAEEERYREALAREPPLTVEELERRMRPGAFSHKGFLGRQERLEDVRAADAQRVEELGFSTEELAASLEALLMEALSASDFWSPQAHRGHFETAIVEYFGYQECPWLSPHDRWNCSKAEFTSIDWRIQNLRTGDRLSGPGLIVHLIREHGFFEGRESPYRVDPGDIVRVLELGS